MSRLRCQGRVAHLAHQRVERVIDQSRVPVPGRKRGLALLESLLRQAVWTAEGRDTATLDGFFDELGEERSQEITAVSMDMSPATPVRWPSPATPPRRSSEFVPWLTVGTSTQGTSCSPWLRPCATTTRSTSSRWPPGRWTPCAARCGTPAGHRRRRRHALQGSTMVLAQESREPQRRPSRHLAQAAAAGRAAVAHLAPTR